MRPSATAIDTAAAVASPDELLDTARSLIDAASARAYADPAIDVSCSAGCGACCSQAVPVTAAEIRAIRIYLDDLEPDQRDLFRDRITEAAGTLAAQGITETDWSKADAYFHLGVSCPFLVDGSCGIRAVRPLACREYLVVSDPVHCANYDAEKLVRIRSSRDVVSGFARVAAAFDEGARVILAPAMALPIPEKPTASPKSGPVMARMLSTTRLKTAE